MRGTEKRRSKIDQMVRGGKVMNLNVKQVTPILNLLSIRTLSTLCGYQFRTISCFLLKKLTKINTKSGGDAGKNQS